MPITKCSNGKYRIGTGSCVYDTEQQAAKVWAAIQIAMAEGMPHYTKDGVLWTGETHKDALGKLMTGAVHTEDSEYLYHYNELEIKL